MPHFIVGLRSAASLSLIVIIVTEMFIGADNGLGHAIIDAQQKFDYPDMYAAILCTSFSGYILNLLVRLLEKKIVHWKTI